MKNAIFIATISLLSLPSLVFSGTVCRVVDLGDHVELVCDGDEKYAPVPAGGQKQAPVFEEAAVTGKVPAKEAVRITQPGQTVSSGKAQTPGKVVEPVDAASVVQPVVAKSDAAQEFKSYLQHDQKRILDVAAKRAYRFQLIQEAKRRNPQLPEAKQYIPEDMH